MADVLFAEDSNLVQETVVKEAASLLDASVRAALTDAIDATPLLPHKLSGEEADGPLRSAIANLRTLPGPARAALLPLTGGNTGVQMAGWFNKEINSLEDIKGVRMRIPGLAGKVFTRAGGESVLMPGSEIFTNLQTGVIDAAEWIGPYNDFTFGLHQAAKYYYYPGWHEPGAVLETIVNKEAFESLPTDLQSILKVAARAVNQDMLDEYTARNNQALETLVNDHDVQLRKLPDDVLKKFREITDELVDEIAAEDPLFREIRDSFTEFQKNVSNYHEISEKAVYEMRDLD